MRPSKSYALTEISAEDDTHKCCECGKNAFYIVNNVFAVCESHIIEGLKAFDEIEIITDKWSILDV